MQTPDGDSAAKHDPTSSAADRSRFPASRGIAGRLSIASASLARAATLVAALGVGWAWAATRDADSSSPGTAVASAAAPAAIVRVWLADRDAGRVIGLDRALMVVHSIPVVAPTEVEARSDGGAWVISAAAGDPLGPHRLLRLSAGGATLASCGLDSVHDLAVDPLDRAIVVDGMAGAVRVGVYDDSAVRTLSWSVAGAICAAGDGRRVLVGTNAGTLLRFDIVAPQAPPLVANLGGIVSDVAAGPRAGRWWVLDAVGQGRLALVDSALASLWTRPVQLHALHLAPLPGVERVWIADTTQPHVRRYGPNGVLEVDRADMAAGGLDRACVASAGGALFPAVGALLALDAQGARAPGQGGFDFLVDAASVP